MSSSAEKLDSKKNERPTAKHKKIFRIFMQGEQKDLNKKKA